VVSWYSIEVFDGASSASLWAEAHGDTVVEAAFGWGATDWSWHRHTWGVVLELGFEDDKTWAMFLDTTRVRAALDAVPDPLTGLIVYRGRGGSGFSPEPRRPRPIISSGSAALPLPWALDYEDGRIPRAVTPSINAPTISVGALASLRQRGAGLAGLR
jgi:hypothetical protein